MVGKASGQPDARTDIAVAIASSGTPTAKLNPSEQKFSPIDFSSDLRFGNLRAGASVLPVKTLMPRPGKTLRDRTREEIQQQKAK